MQTRTVILSTLIILFQTSNLSGFEHRSLLLNNNSRALDTCLSYLFRNAYSADETLQFVFKTKADVSVPLSITNPRVIIVTNSKIERKLNLYNNYVISIQNLFCLKVTLQRLMVSPLWDRSGSPRGKYVVVVFTSIDLKKVFELLWSFDIINVVLVLHNKIDRSNYIPQLYMANPFAPGSRCLKKARLDFVKKCDAKLQKIQFYQTVKHLNDCKLNLVTPSPSKDAKVSGNFAILSQLMDYFSNMLNKNVTFIVSPNKTDVLNSPDEDLSISSEVAMPMELLESFDVTHRVYEDQVVWVVPKPATISNIKIIITVFENRVWLMILLVFVVTVAIWWMAKKYAFRDIQKHFLTVWGLSLCIPLALARPQDRALRILLVSILLYSMVVSTCFQCRLISVLTHPIQEPPIRTVEELAETDLMIVSHEALMPSALGRDNYSAHVKLRERFVFEDAINLTKFLCLVAYHSKWATNLGQQSLNMHPKEKGMLRVIDRNTGLVTIQASFAVRKGHYLLHTINGCIRRIVESGFYSYVLSRAAGIVYKVAQDDFHTVLKINHVGGVFIWWLVGLGFAATVFLLELIVYYLHGVGRIINHTNQKVF